MIPWNLVIIEDLVNTSIRLLNQWLMTNVEYERIISVKSLQATCEYLKHMSLRGRISLFNSTPLPEYFLLTTHSLSLQ